MNTKGSRDMNKHYKQVGQIRLLHRVEESPGKWESGFKTFPLFKYVWIDKSKYMPHQGEQEKARRAQEV